LLVYFTTDFMACSEDSAKWLFGNRFALSKVLVINNGIKSALYSFNNEIRDEMRHQLHISDQCVLLGNVGRFTKIKNQKFIVDLVEYAREQKNDVKACLIGSGEELDAVQQYICERYLEDDVILPGLTDKVRDYLMAFDCYVLPSIYEGLPVSGIEAQATGLPCVVSKSVDSKLDISGHVTFLDLADGYKVWWQEIVKSVSGKRSDMGDKVRIAGYDISFNAKKISEVYAR